MKIRSLTSTLLVLSATILSAAESPSLDTDWIPARPEVLTYSSKGKQGDGLYQVSVSRTGDQIEEYMNIIMPGFTKTVWGIMTDEMRPQASKSRIIVQDQVTISTDCSYESDRLAITTLISPLDKVMADTVRFTTQVMDFSQIPLLPRTLPLKPGAEFKFDMLNPQTNSLVPLTIRVVREEVMRDIACYKVEGSDFEGQFVCWIEKEGHHRLIRIEQPGADRVTELVP